MPEGGPGAPLWEQKHPYYCQEGNFFKNGLHHRFASWQDFLEGIGGMDPELNLVVRWDWLTAENGWLEEGEPERLYVVWLLQRKGFSMSSEVPVTRDMEPIVREWLTKRAAKLAETWAPLLEVSPA